MNDSDVIPCAKCGHEQRIKPEWIGRKARCKSCGYKFVIGESKDRPKHDTVTPQTAPDEASLDEAFRRDSSASVTPPAPNNEDDWMNDDGLSVEGAFRNAVRKALADGVVTAFEREELLTFRREHALDSKTAKRIFDEEKATVVASQSQPHSSTSPETLRDAGSEISEHQWRRYYTLAQQMLEVKNYGEAYKYASSALELVPNEPSCWAIKGIAAAHLSIPPVFPFDELTVCLAKALISDDVRRTIPFLQQHIWDAARNYRTLAWAAQEEAKTDANKESLHSGVDVSLQLGMRNLRVLNAGVTKHQPGYLLSVQAIFYARDMQPSLAASKIALVEIDLVLEHHWISSFKDIDGGGTPRGRLVTNRGNLIAEIRKLDPTFQPPEPPREPGCFIATAASGDPNHPLVVELRVFRDEFLQKNTTGKKAIELYYSFSPEAARIISKRTLLRKLVFCGLVVPTAVAARVTTQCVSFFRRRRYFPFSSR